MTRIGGSFQQIFSNRENLIESMIRCLMHLVAFIVRNAERTILHRREETGQRERVALYVVC